MDLWLENIKYAVVIPLIAMMMHLLKSVKKVPYLLPPQIQKIYGVSTVKTRKARFQLAILLTSAQVNLFVMCTCFQVIIKSNSSHLIININITIMLA